MTLDERRMSIAYTDLIHIGELIQHVLRVDAFKLLSEDSKRDLVSADISIDRVRGEVEKYMCEHTAFDSDIPKYANGTERKIVQDV